MRKTKITWSVHLVNRKASGGTFPPGGLSAPPGNAEYDRAGLIIDALQQSVSGKKRARGSPGWRNQFHQTRRCGGQRKGRAWANTDRRARQTDRSGRPGQIGIPNWPRPRQFRKQ